MICSKKDLRDVLRYEKKIYIKANLYNRLIQIIMHEKNIELWRYIKLLRKTEYYYNQKKSIIRTIMYTYYRRRKNIKGLKLGIEIWENTFDKGLTIYHAGNIVINGNAKIGKNCKLHGDNCIGNDGKNDYAPIIGENCDIGVGAKIIGDVKINNNITIGAGAVVIRNFLEDNITLVGVPARKV